jgi:hypothetical protein
MYMQKHGPRSTSFWIPLRFLVIFHAALMLLGGLVYAILVLYIYSGTYPTSRTNNGMQRLTSFSRL